MNNHPCIGPLADNLAKLLRLKTAQSERLRQLIDAYNGLAGLDRGVIEGRLSYAINDGWFQDHYFREIADAIGALREIEERLNA